MKFCALLLMVATVGCVGQKHKTIEITAGQMEFRAALPADRWQVAASESEDGSPLGGAMKFTRRDQTDGFIIIDVRDDDDMADGRVRSLEAVGKDVAEIENLFRSETTGRYDAAKRRLIITGNFIDKLFGQAHPTPWTVTYVVTPHPRHKDKVIVMEGMVPTKDASQLLADLESIADSLKPL